MARLAAFATDRRHVRAIRAHGFAALAAGFARFFGRELVSGTQPMGSASAQARDASLLFGIHRSESAAAGFRVVSVIHGDYLLYSERCDCLAEPTVVKIDSATHGLSKARATVFPAAMARADASG
jgi:hypothetical protein